MIDDNVEVIIENELSVIVVEEQEPSVLVIEQSEPEILEIVTEGPTGPPGPSVYELAVQNGYVGTEEGWLATFGIDLSQYATKTELTDVEQRFEEEVATLDGGFF